jgi:ubiquinone/menaquinone biosynthesis C-methylase UbiE
MNRFDRLASNWEKDEKRTKLAKLIFNSIKENLILRTNLTIADIGTGTGLLLVQLLPYAKQIDGFDNSQAMMNVLREKLISNEIKNVETVTFNADKDELPENKYDLVVSSMAFHHIAETENILKKISKSLKIGGQIAIADLETEDGTFHSEMTDDIKHKGFDKSGFEQLMKNSGFENAEVKTAFSVIREEKSYPVFLAFGRK